MPRRPLHESEDEAAEINLSPMIDCIFILLIFFIVTTVFVETPEVEVVKPEAMTDEALDRHSIIIAITAQDKVIYAGREIGVSGVRLRLRQLLQGDDVPVIIQADRETSHSVFSQVWSEAKNAGATRIRIATLNES
ncbi:MAG: biopolymer transporter ExbD [Verrucomicrobiota bacterium JB022]|nr:biopolymer transporter ExbD [Verrucomicrobiota bacterium JB022]